MILYLIYNRYPLLFIVAIAFKEVIKAFVLLKIFHNLIGNQMMATCIGVIYLRH
jgi:hypothetical protein